ncbi:MAG: FG-GAP-like repeat-containing protein [Candidatus Poseidoniaceae archaeon]|nr:FG-GAP-like repeat-containing protein [Candidatus Poseidoniaceae archaeon]
MAILPLLLLIFTSLSPIITNQHEGEELLETSQSMDVLGQQWDQLSQPWAQYGRTATHNGTMPLHSVNGGPGQGNVSDVSEYGIIDSPVINWQAFDNDDGSDAYGSVIGDFSNSINAPEAAIERCGLNKLFAVLILSESNGNGFDSKLTIISGDDAKTAWQGNLGETRTIRSTPVILDADADGRMEIIVTYDTDAALVVEMWSPELSCSESGWQTSGHSNEKLWSYSNADYRIGITSPHLPTSQSDHYSITQPLLADLSLDGSPELVLALVDENTNDPTLIALPLTASSAPVAEWEVALDRGTHPSDPTWAALDSSNTAIVLTTIDSSTGSMWIWRIDGATGSLDWERVAIQGTDYDEDAPRLRLPGPVIAQLDNDDAPEMILTVPTDANGRTSGQGARFIGMELTSTDEVFNFRAPNGYADAQPLVVDTDADGIHDRLCWVTWYSESTFNFNRKGMVGCHDISLQTPLKDWSRDMQRGSGTDNDEIAVSPPIWMDLDGDSTPEIIVAFGKRLWAFDGVSGASADISNAWSSPLSLPHRAWAAPAIADMDGDGTLDILIGDTLVSQRVADLAPLLDGRGISFNPAQVDPGQQVTITGQFSNIGTVTNDDSVDAVLLVNDVEIKRQRFDEVNPIAPSGEGGPQTFSVDITAELGIHNVEMRLDINSNITEAREDNNIATSELVVVEPYVVRIDIPSENQRISPGSSSGIAIDITAIGSKTSDWTVTWDDSNLPSGWTFDIDSASNSNPNLQPNTPHQIIFDASIPSSALGDENSFVDITATLDSDVNISFTTRLPIEVLRTRGLSIVGPDGLGSSQGVGRPGYDASAWIMVENLGNAHESSTSIDWTAPSWGGTPSLRTADGIEVFSLDLDPKEKMELFATLHVDSMTQLGSTTSTTLTICIGSGSETICEDMDVNLTASAVVVSPIHTRTLPNATLQWEINADLPASGHLEWNMVAAQMVHSNWIWSASGDLTINGNMLEMDGIGNSEAVGTLTVILPVNALPARHTFQNNDSLMVDHDILFTLQVVQIHRAEATILSPLPELGEEIVSMNVSEPQRILLRLENPGNGQDEYILSGASVAGLGMTSAPDVEFILYNPQRTLGALATTIATVDVTLSQEIPAQTPFQLAFTWQSIINESATITVYMDVEAEPDHQWDLDLQGGHTINVIPSQLLELNMTLTNIGNSVDNVTLKPRFSMSYSGSDSSSWSAQEVSSNSVEINASANVILSVSIPSNTWAGTETTMTIDLYSGALMIGQTVVNITVDHVSGWRFNLSQTSLEVIPEGQNITLTVQQLGNSPEAPFIFKAGQGWMVDILSNSSVIDPGQMSTVTVFVTPPTEAVAGEVGVLRLRISDWDGSGSIVEEIPVRVGAAPNINIEHRGVWLLSETGGLPTAWVNNLGNDVSILQLNVNGLPSGWEVAGDTQMVIAPRQSLGIPINLIPDANWDGQRFLVSIEVTHPTLGLHSYDVEVEGSEVAFTSSPVLFGIDGQQLSVSLSSNVQLSSSDNFQQQGDVLSFTLGTESNEIVLDQPNSQTPLKVYVSGQALPSVTVECTLNSNSFANLGIIELSGSVGDCLMFASQDESLHATMMIVTDSGEKVDLIQQSIVIGTGQNATIDANVSGWIPQAGTVKITLLIVDNYGRTLAEESVTTISRASGWNIGIHSFNADGDILIGIERAPTYERLANTICQINIKTDGGDWEVTKIIDITASDYAPTILINNPGVLKTDMKLTATLSCEQPYDIDDNLEDNVMSTFYKEDSTITIEGSDMVVAGSLAAILIVIAWFAGLFKVSSNEARNRPSTDSPRKTPSNSGMDDSTETDQSAKQEVIRQQHARMEDEITLHSDDGIDPIQNTKADLEMIEVIENTEAEDTSALGRFASLRREIKGDEDIETPSGPIEDRMDKFFDD